MRMRARRRRMRLAVAGAALLYLVAVGALLTPLWRSQPQQPAAVQLDRPQRVAVRVPLAALDARADPPSGLPRATAANASASSSSSSASDAATDTAVTPVTDTSTPPATDAPTGGGGGGTHRAGTGETIISSEG